jgi:hypothetical protein
MTFASDSLSFLLLRSFFEPEPLLVFGSSGRREEGRTPYLKGIETTSTVVREEEHGDPISPQDLLKQ